MIESSPSSSAESSFRELDEVFLQTQTRIWLGELLNTRLDEDLALPDLLQDGEILFQVSRVVWDFLMTKCMELRHLKHKYGPFASKKSSGRYRPYSNVDFFLKVCKILGLNGIDLFSPSDVVEKRNIRKVCICIRALSKKARSKQLSVPDFDMVTYSVTMSTDMVGVLRRSLESPQCTFSSSSSYGSLKGSKTKLKKTNLFSADIRDGDSSSSDESDEAESRYMGENSFSSPSNFDNADGVNSDLEDSHENGYISGQYRTKDFVESDGKCKPDSDIDEDISCYSVSKKISHDGSSNVNGEERQTYNNGNADDSNVNLTPENDDPYMGDSSCIEMGQNNYIANYLAFSDLMVHANDGSNSVVCDGENNMFDFFLNVEPQGATTGERSFHNGSQRVYSDDEEMEVSSTTSMTSVLGRLLNLEFDNQYDVDDLLSSNVNSSASKELEFRKLYKNAPVLSEPSKEGTFHSQLFDPQEAEFKRTTRLSSSVECCLPSQEEGELPILEHSKDGNAAGNIVHRNVIVANDDPERPLSEEDDDKQAAIILDTDENTVDHGGSICLEFSSKHILVEDIAFQGINIQDSPTQSVSGDINTYSSILQTNIHETVSASVQVEDTNTAQEDSSAQNNISPTDENGDQDKREMVESDSQPPSTKHKINPLLKTVVKGTAVAGVIFLLLHIRKTNANSAHERRQNPQTLKYNGSKPSSGKQQTRSVGKGVYPTEKLKL
ncbi:mitogen-activated protein kinase kinase kinase [Salvia divinorum]|uniref:Mitogen-activated protein kinase kinase kinase n=1 Tax=Salvia divinorum TaxID=28513 RepID=A0ABD1G4J1_SALDI